jgi:outer membrane lipoprotein SlyB
MSDKKVDEEKKGSQGGMPLAAIGLILGAAAGMALGGPLVAAMGAGVGLVLGAAVDAWRKREDSS